MSIGSQFCFDHIVSLLRGHFLSKVLHLLYPSVAPAQMLQSHFHVTVLCVCVREFETVAINEGTLCLSLAPGACDAEPIRRSSKKCP